ncbi:hypothetical protein RCL1_001108 [Eukaryota sp. TZLM3-RCL]
MLHETLTSITTTDLTNEHLIAIQESLLRFMNYSYTLPETLTLTVSQQRLLLSAILLMGPFVISKSPAIISSLLNESYYDNDELVVFLRSYCLKLVDSDMFDASSFEDTPIFSHFSTFLDSLQSPTVEASKPCFRSYTESLNGNQLLELCEEGVSE